LVYVELKSGARDVQKGVIDLEMVSEMATSIHPECKNEGQPAYTKILEGERNVPPQWEGPERCVR